MQLVNHDQILVKQIFEGAEFFGYESRNKYEILDSSGKQVGYASEQGKSVFGMMMRQSLGHFRKFDINLYDENRQHILTAHHPFRWYFKELQLNGKDGKSYGRVRKEFTIINKKFSIDGGLEMKAPFWRIWRFPVYNQQEEEVARIEKKWTGVFAEAFTDKDTFLVSFYQQNLSEETRRLLVTTAVMIDLLYFEKKA